MLVEGYGAVRTDIHTSATIHAGFFINNSFVVLNLDGFGRAFAHAIPASAAFVCINFRRHTALSPVIMVEVNCKAPSTTALA